MNKSIHSLFALLVAVIFALYSATPAFAAGTEPQEALPVVKDSGAPSAGDNTGSPDLEEIPEEPRPADTVYTQEELAAWLEEHAAAGGKVTLGDMLTITEPLFIDGYSQEPIVIHTGEFGLVLDGAQIDGHKRLLITGEGVAVPVVDVVRIDTENPWVMNANHTLMTLNITATGREGRGGTALRILAEDTKPFQMDAIQEQGVIRSYGKGAVGLWLEVPMQAYCYRVEVEGENSTAVHAPMGADLYYCKLKAKGRNARSAIGTDLLLDTCAATPKQQGVKHVNRRVLPESLERLYLYTPQGEEPTNLIRFFNLPNFFLSGGNGLDAVTRSFAVYWDFDAYNALDTSKEGTSKIAGTVSPVFDGLGLFDNIVLELMVEVRNPGLPCISRISIFEWDEGRYARLHFWDSYDPEEDAVVLWRSDDEGKTWQDATHTPGFDWGYESVDLPCEALANPTWFQLEAVGLGESNVVALYEKDGVTYGGTGGDRTGTDREGANVGSGGGTKPGSEENTKEPGGAGSTSLGSSLGSGHTNQEKPLVENPTDENQPAVTTPTGTGQLEREPDIGTQAPPDTSVEGTALPERELPTAVPATEKEHSPAEAVLLQEPIDAEQLPALGSVDDTQESGEAKSNEPLAEVKGGIESLPGSAAGGSGQKAPPAAVGKGMIVVFLTLSAGAAGALAAIRLRVNRR